MVNPLLLEIPDEFSSERLTLRAPRAGDGSQLHEAVKDSHNELRPWMPWAKHVASIEDCEEYCRRCRIRYLAREDLSLLVFLKNTSTLIGSSGLHRMDWTVPRFEIGYWTRSQFTKHGYATEAVGSLTLFAFKYLKAERLEIQVDDKNLPSCRVAERAAFKLEAVLKNYKRDVMGRLSDIRIYAMMRSSLEPGASQC